MGLAMSTVWMPRNTVVAVACAVLLLLSCSGGAQGSSTVAGGSTSSGGSDATGGRSDLQSASAGGALAGNRVDSGLACNVYANVTAVSAQGSEGNYVFSVSV